MKSRKRRAVQSKRAKRGTPPQKVPRGVSIIAQRVPPYPAKWHAVNDWAFESLDNLGFDVESKPSRNPRVEIVRGSNILDIMDDEEAYARGVPLQDLDLVPPGPSRAKGGIRRVNLRLFTWVLDRVGLIAYDPQWIIGGYGFSGHSASASLARYVRSYALAVSKGIESRRLVVTAIDIVWWTAQEGTDYV